MSYVGARITISSQKEQNLGIWVLQGGGKRTALQAGFFAACLANGMEPEVMVCTSGGAQNAALISAGFAKGGAECAIRNLERYWQNVGFWSDAAKFSDPFSWSKFFTTGTVFEPMANTVANVFRDCGKSITQSMVNHSQSFHPLIAMLREVIGDENLLNRPESKKIIANAVVQATGEQIIFTQSNGRLTFDMMAASGAYGAIPPVHIPKIGLCVDGIMAGGPNTNIQALFERLHALSENAQHVVALSLANHEDTTPMKFVKDAGTAFEHRRLRTLFGNQLSAFLEHTGLPLFTADARFPNGIRDSNIMETSACEIQALWNAGWKQGQEIARDFIFSQTHLSNHVGDLAKEWPDPRIS